MGWYARHGIDPRRWAAVRRAVFKRDRWRCCRCGRPGRLECHHIRALADGGARYAPDNLETLCRSCHIGETRRHNRNRKPVPARVAAWASLVNDLRKDAA